MKGLSFPMKVQLLLVSIVMHMLLTWAISSKLTWTGKLWMMEFTSISTRIRISRVYKYDMKCYLVNFNICSHTHIIWCSLYKLFICSCKEVMKYLTRRQLLKVISYAPGVQKASYFSLVIKAGTQSLVLNLEKSWICIVYESSNHIKKICFFLLWIWCISLLSCGTLLIRK